jgi:hypothetical protein
MKICPVISQNDYFLDNTGFDDLLRTFQKAMTDTVSKNSNPTANADIAPRSEMRLPHKPFHFDSG